MALEASDRLIDYFESIGGVPVDVFQGLPSNSVPPCLTSWEMFSKWTSILPKLWQNGIRTTKSRYWIGHHKALTPLQRCVRARRPTNLIQLHQLCQEEWAKITKWLIVGSLWKATQNVWPKINNLKAMLPKTNWVYVNFWPTGNVMKEIKA